MGPLQVWSQRAIYAVVIVVGCFMAFEAARLALSGQFSEGPGWQYTGGALLTVLLVGVMAWERAQKQRR